MIEIKSEKMPYGINFPTSINELTPDVLKTITEGVKLPKHYCIIALAFDTKIFEFCAAMNSSRNTNVAVTPILAKISQEDSENVNASIGDKIIIDRSSLERGVHLNLKTAISSTSARKYFNNDPELAKAVMTKNDNKIAFDRALNKKLTAAQSPNIIILEFKICPVNDISAAIPMNYHGTDLFLVKDNNMN